MCSSVEECAVGKNGMGSYSCAGLFEAKWWRIIARSLFCDKRFSRNNRYPLGGSQYPGKWSCRNSTVVKEVVEGHHCI